MKSIGKREFLDYLLVWSCVANSPKLFVQNGEGKKAGFGRSDSIIQVMKYLQGSNRGDIYIAKGPPEDHPDETYGYVSSLKALWIRYDRFKQEYSGNHNQFYPEHLLFKRAKWFCCTRMFDQWLNDNMDLISGTILGPSDSITLEKCGVKLKETKCLGAVIVGIQDGIAWLGIRYEEHILSALKFLGMLGSVYGNKENERAVLLQQNVEKADWEWLVKLFNIQEMLTIIGLQAPILQNRIQFPPFEVIVGKKEIYDIAETLIPDAAGDVLRAMTGPIEFQREGYLEFVRDVIKKCVDEGNPMSYICCWVFPFGEKVDAEQELQRRREYFDEANLSQYVQFFETDLKMSLALLIIGSKHLIISFPFYPTTPEFRISIVCRDNPVLVKHVADWYDNYIKERRVNS